MSKRRLFCGHLEWHHGKCAEMTCSNYVNKHVGERWPSDADEEATRELVALADELSAKVNRDPMPLTGVALVNLYLDVEAILLRHDRNPRKLLDAMHHLSEAGND